MSASKWSKEERDLARVMHAEGSSHRKIAAAVGHSQSSVGRMLRASAEYEPNHPNPAPQAEQEPRTQTEPPFSSSATPPRVARPADATSGRLLGVFGMREDGQVETLAVAGGVGSGTALHGPSYDEWLNMPKTPVPHTTLATVVLPVTTTSFDLEDPADVLRVLALACEETGFTAAEVRAALATVRPGERFGLEREPGPPDADSGAAQESASTTLTAPAPSEN